MRITTRTLGTIAAALGLAWQAAAANSKVSALTADASPTSDDLVYTVNDPGGTAASRKCTLANLRTLMTTDIGDLNLNADSELTISSGAVTATQSFHSVDTEGDAADDDLDTINGGTDGDVLWLTPANDARDVWITPAGNVDTPSGRKYPIPRGTAAGLIYDGTNWRLVYCGDWGFTHDHTISITDDPVTAAQIQAILSLYPRHIPQGVDIIWQFGDGTYDDTMTSALTWDGFYGGGTMTIQGNTGEAVALHENQAVFLDFSGGTSAGMIVQNCNLSDITVKLLKIKCANANSAYCLTFSRCSGAVYAAGNYCYYATDRSATTRCISIDHCPLSRLYYNYVGLGQKGISVNYSAWCFSYANDDGSAGTPEYGLYADAAHIRKGEGQPDGNTSAEATWWGTID